MWNVNNDYIWDTKKINHEGKNFGKINDLDHRFQDAKNNLKC